MRAYAGQVRLPATRYCHLMQSQSRRGHPTCQCVGSRDISILSREGGIQTSCNRRGSGQSPLTPRLGWICVELKLTMTVCGSIDGSV